MAVSAFTSAYDRLSNRLATEAKVQYGKKELTVNALWDTGATRTCISFDVVSALNLIPYGKQQMQTPSDPYIANLYMVDIVLPNNLKVVNVVVCDSKIGAFGIGALIGMDIIGLGDFAVSNYNNKTVFTFRTPSQEKTDYVAKVKLQNVIAANKNKGQGKSRFHK